MVLESSLMSRSPNPLSCRSRWMGDVVVGGEEEEEGEGDDRDDDE